MLNHRCNGSLRAGVSINKNYRFEIMRMDHDTEEWRLFHYIYNSDYNCVNREYVCEVKYCPFCGIKLH